MSNLMKTEDRNQGHPGGFGPEIRSKSEDSTMKLVGGLSFGGSQSPSPGRLCFLFIVPALPFVKDHKKKDKFSHVHGSVALLMKYSFLADQKGTYQARMDVFFLEDSRSKLHIFFSLSGFSLII